MSPPLPEYKSDLSKLWSDLINYQSQPMIKMWYKDTCDFEAREGGFKANFLIEKYFLRSKRILKNQIKNIENKILSV